MFSIGMVSVGPFSIGVFSFGFFSIGNKLSNVLYIVTLYSKNTSKHTRALTSENFFFDRILLDRHCLCGTLRTGHVGVGGCRGVFKRRTGIRACHDTQFRLYRRARDRCLCLYEIPL